VPSLFLSKTKTSVDAFLRAYDIKLHDSVAQADDLPAEPYLACVSLPPPSATSWAESEASEPAAATGLAQPKPGPRCSNKPRTSSLNRSTR
jgi:hypothetical protein